MTRDKRLGRGLEALLGRTLEPGVDTGEGASALPPTDPEDPRFARDEQGQLWLDITSIDRNPYQPRQSFDETEIADLADSIREHGVLQPLVVRPAGERFDLIAGERRLRAAQAAAWTRVPVQVRQVTDRQMAELAIVENVQRRDLNAIEKGISFQRYLEEYQCTQEELARRIHIDRSTIANLIRLLELPQVIKEQVMRGELSQGHARTLLPLGEEQLQIEFSEQIRREGLSVRATEAMVSDKVNGLDDDLLSLLDSDEKEVGGGRKRPAKTRSEHLASLEQQLRGALGTKVEIKQGARGKGRMTIHFQSPEEFERLMGIMVPSSPPQARAA